MKGKKSKSLARLVEPAEIKWRRRAVTVHQACFYGMTAFVKKYLECHEDINKVNNKGETPLHVAAKHGTDKVVSTLVDNNCDVNILTEHGESALSLAVSFSHLKVVKILLANGASINHLSPINNRSLLYRCNHDEMLQYLINKGARCTVDELLLLASNGNYFMLNKLLKEFPFMLPFETVTSRHAFNDLVIYMSQIDKVTFIRNHFNGSALKITNGSES